MSSIVFDFQNHAFSESGTGFCFHVSDKKIQNVVFIPLLRIVENCWGIKNPSYLWVICDFKVRYDDPTPKTYHPKTIKTFGGIKGSLGRIVNFCQFPWPFSGHWSFPKISNLILSVDPPGNNLISHRKGKSSTQRWPLVRDMWSFPGGDPVI